MIQNLKCKVTEELEIKSVNKDDHTTDNIEDLDYGDLESINLEDSQEAIEVDSDASEESSWGLGQNGKDKYLNHRNYKSKNLLKSSTVNHTKDLFVLTDAYTAANHPNYSNLDECLDDSRKTHLFSIDDFIQGHR